MRAVAIMLTLCLLALTTVGCTSSPDANSTFSTVGQKVGAKKEAASVFTESVARNADVGSGSVITKNDLTTTTEKISERHTDSKSDAAKTSDKPIGFEAVDPGPGGDKAKS